MALRLRNSRSRACATPRPAATGGSDQSPVGSGEPEGARGGPDDAVTEARYWSAPSFVI